MGTYSWVALAEDLGGEPRGQLVDRVVEAAREHLGMDVGFLAEFQGDHEVFRSVAGAGDTFGFEESSALALEETYCGRMVEQAIPNTVVDARNDPGVAGLDITREADIGAYIGVPVRLPSGRLYGTMCCLSHQAEPDLRQRDVRFMEVLAKVVAAELGREEAEQDRRRALAEEVTWVLEASALSVVFQPVLRLDDRRVVGMEALSRFDAEPQRAPDQWFAAAWEAGLGLELEMAAVRAALAELERLPDGAFLSINASPATLSAEAFVTELRRVDGRRIVVEVTEHALVHQFDALCEAADRLRAHDVRLAIDDAGAGYSGLNRMVALAPEVIKLDRFLTRGIDGDPARRALAAAAAAFADQSHTRVIAEGIETEAELETLAAVGIRYGQGYHLGRPAPLDTHTGTRPASP